MAANSYDEEKAYFPGIADVNRNLPVSCSCFQLLKPSFDEVNHHCSLDVLPILIEEDPFPGREKCPFHSSHVQDVYGISVLPDEGNTSPDCTSQLTFLSFVEVPFPSKNQMNLDTELDCQKCIDLQMKSADTYSSCIVDINIEKGSLETLKSNDETVGSIKNEGIVTHMQKVLQRQASLNIDKSPSERTHDAPANRWRRYRRAASFDSRKVVLLFSILSSLGTLILIYLTLRVRQNGDGYNHL
ncbi:Adenine deaminase [Melia azedarach]|uniref:Adenine deaminase n=1 Tax=Melia azedarach TaxID=155640 RepID=A0ACC1XW90_MELAZ|nr:Adenine deaminase [Melia azedarach]